jgi:hypothetical protein
MPGQPIPGGNVLNCYTSNPPTVCPAGSDMPGQPVPGGDVNNCFTSNPPTVCPAGSDMPGQPIPGGDVNNCYTSHPPEVCPAGTDHAGEPIPAGGIVNCNDDVLGGQLHNPGGGGGDLVQGNRQENLPENRPATKGKVLPFTGASVTAYLVVALWLMAAGALMLRPKRRVEN